MHLAAWLLSTLLLALACLCGPSAMPGAQTAPASAAAEVQRLIVQLGDADPAVRDAAMQSLWDLRESAAEALREAARSQNAEVATRASLLLRRMELGVGPQASESLVRMVILARNSPDRAERSAARQRLAAMQATASPAIAQLIRDAVAGQLAEGDVAGEVLRDLRPLDRWVLARVADELSRHGDRAALLAWLEAAAGTGAPLAAANLAYAARESGKLAEILPRWRDRAEAEPSPQNRRVLACLLFAADDSEAAELMGAMPEGGSIVPVAWALLDGDVEAARRAASLQPEELTRLTLSLVIARAAGDEAESESEAALAAWLRENWRQVLETVRKERTTPHVALVRRAIVAATVAGEIDIASALADEVDAAALLRLLARRLDFQGAEDVGARHAPRDDPQRRAVQMQQARVHEELRIQGRGGRSAGELSSFGRRRVEATDAMRDGDNTRAADLLGQLARIDEGDPALRWAYGHAQALAGDAEAGRAQSESAVFMPLADSVVRRGIADEMWLHGLRDESIDQHRQAARWSTLAPADALPALDGYFERLMEEGRHAEAGRAVAAGLALLLTDAGYEAAAEADRAPYWAFFLAAELERSRMGQAIAAGEWDEAQRALDRSMSYLPQSDGAIILITALDAAGNREAADLLFIECFSRIQRASERYRQSSLLSNQAAWLAASCNRRLDTALNLAQTAVACDMSSPAALDTLAEVYLRIGQSDRARELLDRILVLAEARDEGSTAPYGQFNDYLERRQEILQRLDTPAAQGDERR